MSDDFQLNCPVPLSDHATVQLAHGGGGRLMRDLIEGMFLPAFAAGQGRAGKGRAGQGRAGQGRAGQGGEDPRACEHAPYGPPHDSAVLPVEGARLAFTTDTFVVSPLFFPGGDIGTLAVYGTVNDLAMAGAKPAYLSAGFILEEGLPMETLRRVVASMCEAARAAGVQIVTGDTKVVDRGKGDGIFINTAGIGWVPPGVDISPARVAAGDVILLSGDLGRHGIAIMSVREGLCFEGALESDCAPLAGLVEAMLGIKPRPAVAPSVGGATAGRGFMAEVHCLRDLTRGGLASALNEIAADAGVGMELD